MYQITIPDSERMFRPFVPDEHLVRVEQMLFDLHGLSVRAQLHRRRIKKISVSFRMPEREGSLPISIDGDSLEILLGAGGEYIWPLVVGHEIAHSYISFVQLDGRPEIHRKLTTPRKDEALCDHFAFCWLLEGSNAEELERLLAPLARQKEQAQGLNEYQLEMPL